MEDARRLKRFCEAYIKRTMVAHTFDLPDFVAYMEPAYRKLGFRTIDRRAQENILVIRLDGISGCVMTTGFLRELRRNKPQAHITLVVNSTVYPLMETCPYADEVFAFAFGSKMALQDILRAAFLFCQHRLWHRHYDVCFCPQWGMDQPWTLFLGYLSGARERVGYGERIYQKGIRQSQDYHLLLSRVLTCPLDVIHEVSRAFYMLQDFGMKVESDQLELWFDAEDRAVAQKLLVNFAGKHPFIVVSLGAHQASGKYPVEQYVTALRRVADTGARFVLLGGSDADLEGDFFTRSMPKGTVLNLVGQTYLRVMGAILSQAALYIGNDTGFLHMASAFRVPVIEVMAEAVDKKEEKNFYSSYERFFPWHTPAIVLRPAHALPPCNETAVLGGCCTTMPHCICRVSPEQIVDAYNAMVDYLAEEDEVAK